MALGLKIMEIPFSSCEVISCSHSDLELLQEEDSPVGEVGIMNEDRSKKSWKLTIHVCPRGGKML